MRRPAIPRASAGRGCWGRQRERRARPCSCTRARRAPVERAARRRLARGRLGERGAARAEGRARRRWGVCSVPGGKRRQGVAFHMIHGGLRRPAWRGAPARPAARGQAAAATRAARGAAAPARGSRAGGAPPGLRLERRAGIAIGRQRAATHVTGVTRFASHPRHSPRLMVANSVVRSSPRRSKTTAGRGWACNRVSSRSGYAQPRDLQLMRPQSCAVGGPEPQATSRHAGARPLSPTMRALCSPLAAPLSPAEARLDTHPCLRSGCCGRAQSRATRTSAAGGAACCTRRPRTPAATWVCWEGKGECKGV